MASTGMIGGPNRLTVALGHGARCLSGALTVSVVALLVLASTAAASPSAEQRLADTYSPIVMLRAQQKAHGNELCDPFMEQYWPPTSVDAVLGQPRVRLMNRVGGRTRVIKRSPTAADLAGRREGVYLNLPGSPLSAGCHYARDFAALRRAGSAPAVTYAHIAREAGHPGLALQYWFYYYFNQFNDVHESDWEGMQITFRASTAAQALSQGPDQIVLFQHSGGEHADWSDSKVHKRATHPIVYSAAGSHATFYGSALWLGNGQNGSGVGCDNTTGPLLAVTPRTVLLPDFPVAEGKFAWLTYSGRWGQRESGFNNGPAGPNTKTVWREPFTWMDGTRSASPEVPGGALMGPSVANAFCGAVEGVTSFLNLAAKTTPGAIGVGVGILLLLVVPLSLTRWRPVRLEPFGQRRAFGQLLLASGRLYGRHGRTLMLISLTSLLILGALEGLELLIREALNARGSGLSFSDSGVKIAVSTPGGFGRLLVGPIASAAVIAFIRNLQRDQRTGFAAAWRAVLRRLWRLLAVALVANALVILLLVTIIGIPYGIKKFVDWQFAQQEILFEDRSIREALRGSTHVVKEHWWKTAAVAGALWLLSQVPGPALGFALVFTTVPVAAVNVLGALVFALLLPFIQSGRTLLYLDLRARDSRETVPTPIAVAPAGAA